MELVFEGRSIKTTAEHPFYVPARQAFVPAAELKAGDKLVSHDGRLIAIASVCSTEAVATVYNLRVADHHTYFVGGTIWGWDVWVHNASYKRLLPYDSNDPTHLRAQLLREQLTDYAKSTVVGYRKNGKPIYLHEDVTFAVGVARTLNGTSEVLVSSSRGGSLPAGVAAIIGNARWVTGGRRPNGGTRFLNHAEQRLLREVDSAEGYVGLEAILPTRKPCNGANGCRAELSARSSQGFGDFDRF